MSVVLITSAPAGSLMRQVGRLEVALAEPPAALTAIADATADWAPQALQVLQAPHECFVLSTFRAVNAVCLCDLNSFCVEQGLGCIIQS